MFQEYNPNIGRIRTNLVGIYRGVEDTYLMTTGNVVPDTLVGMLVVLYQ